MGPGAQAELDAALGAVVEDMRLATDELAAVLEEERVALAGADAEAIDRTGAHKQRLMERLEQYDAERVQLAANAPDAAGQLAPAWQRILRRLADCRDLNQRNGLLVGLRLAQVRRALAVLAGHDGEAAGTYGPGGELRTRTRSQRLAEA
ncbi:flagella synthesis protein FlgN [Frateuria defendens]|uniref:flagella synthesis protein FlgN n=1 Tax=Frateuria defendens TaxID=2219559 RepID=UPI00066FD01B|nr:flagellar protein FlgN [Frateuria defendens]